MAYKQRSNRQIYNLSVGEFFNKNSDELGLSLQGSDVGFDRLIKEPTINRPGLVLAGFFTYFAFRRIQVIGNSENSYLKSLTKDQRIKLFTKVVARVHALLFPEVLNLQVNSLRSLKVMEYLY